MNLFINELEFEKTAMIYLDADSTTWVKTIITELVTKFPPLQQYPMTVNWQKKDDRRGYAVGSLKILNGTIPVIIEDYQLYPLDVLIFGNASMPLTSQVLDEMLSNNSPFQGATNVNPKKSLELFGDSFQYSPINGSPGVTQSPGSETRDAVKVASFIDRIMVDEESAQELLTKIANENLFSNYKENGTEGVLRKIADRSQISEAGLEKLAYFSADMDRIFKFKDEFGNEFIKIASSEIDDFIVKPLAGKNAIENRYAEKNSGSMEKIAEFTVVEEEIETIKGATGYFEYEGVKTANFEILDIKFLKNTVNAELFDNLMEKTAYLIDSGNDYMKLEGNIEKIANDFKLDRVKTVNTSDYGVFEWNGKIVGPVTISSIYGEQNLEKTAQMTIEGYASFETIKFYKKNVNFDIIPHDLEKNAWYLPKDVNFIKLNKFYNDPTFMTKVADVVTNNNILEVVVLEDLQTKSYFIDPSFNTMEDNLIPANAEFKRDSLVKTAGFDEDLVIKDKHYVLKDSYGFYNLIGPEFNKYAQLGHTITNLSENDALWALIHLGASEEDVIKVAKADKSSEIEVENELKAPKSKDKVSKEAKDKIKGLKESDIEEVNETVKKASELTGKLIKAAAVLPEMVTVDAVLSLGLMKSFNIAEYIQLIPDYERIIGELCKLLITVRLGMKQIPEAPVKNAVESLTEVLYSLKQLGMVLQNQTKK